MKSKKKDQSRVAKSQKWELATVAKKFRVSQQTVKIAIAKSVTPKGKHSIARVNVEKALRLLIAEIPGLVKKKKAA